MGDCINITVSGLGEDLTISILVRDACEPEFGKMFLDPALESLRAQIMQVVEDRIMAREVYQLASYNLVDSTKQ